MPLVDTRPKHCARSGHPQDAAPAPRCTKLVDTVSPRFFFRGMRKLCNPLNFGPILLVVGLGAVSSLEAQAQRRCRVADVSVTPPDAQARVGASYPFLALAYDATGTPCDNQPTITWRSSNPSIAVIDASGIARAIAVGTAHITATAGVGAAARSGSSVLTVDNTEVAPVAAGPGNIRYVPGRPTGPGYAAFDRQPDGSGPAEGIVVAPLQLSLARGESQYLDFHAARADGSNAQRVPIVFGVDPGGERTVAVDTLGLVTSLSEPGLATVRLTVPGNPRIQPIPIRVEVRADSLRFNHPRLSITPGSTDTLSIYGPGLARAVNPRGLFRFASTDTTKVRVNPFDAIVTAVAPGRARIIAQSSLYQDIVAEINVHRAVTRLDLTPADSQVTIAIGGSVTLRATALAGDGTPVPEAPLTWRVGDSTTVTFDPATGVVRGRRTGMTDITVRVPAGVDTDSIRTIHVRVVAGGLAATPSRIGIPHDSRAPVDVVILDDQRNAVGSAMSLLTWTSSADTVARVEGDAIVTQRPGRARLTARALWDSTVTVDAYVVGDVIVAGQYQGRRDLLVKWNAGQNWSPLTSDSLVELQAAWSPDLTRVLFCAQAPVQQRTPTSALYLMNMDGSQRVRLTDDSAMVRFPVFVPGSRRVVFEWSRGGRQQVWALDSAGATPRQLTQTPSANMAPSVAPDGRRLAYVSSRESSPGHSTWGIYTATLDGADERPFLSVPPGQRVDAPVYAPDGRALYFLRSEQGRPPTQRVYRRALDAAPGDTAVALTPPTLFVRSFSVSGDGAVLALNVLETQGNQQASHVVLYTVATGATQTLDSSPEERLASPVLRPPTPSSAAPQH